MTETATQRQTKTQFENVQKHLGCKFKFAIADAGYGSEENYDYLEKKEITGAVKYSTYENETKRSFKKKVFNADNWKYDSEQKEYTCPFRELCTKSEYGRMIQRNENWISQKTKVKKLLANYEYKILMKKRSTECETVFGRQKGI